MKIENHAGRQEPHRRKLQRRISNLQSWESDLIYEPLQEFIDLIGSEIYGLSIDEWVCNVIL